MLLKEKLQNARQSQVADDELAKELEDMKRQVSLITKVLLTILACSMSRSVPSFERTPSTL